MKNRYFIWSKNRIFFKGGKVTHDFGKKFELFLLFGLFEKGLEMMVGDVLDRKEAFLDYKNMYFI